MASLPDQIIGNARSLTGIKAGSANAKRRDAIIAEATVIKATWAPIPPPSGPGLYPSARLWPSRTLYPRPPR